MKDIIKPADEESCRLLVILQMSEELKAQFVFSLVVLVVVVVVVVVVVLVVLVVLVVVVVLVVL